MVEVQGPAEVMKGTPLKVAMPLLSVKRCCMGKKEKIDIRIKLRWGPPRSHHPDGIDFEAQDQRKTDKSPDAHWSDFLQLFFLWIENVFWFPLIAAKVRISELWKNHSQSQGGKLTCKVQREIGVREMSKRVRETECQRQTDCKRDT